MTDLPKELANEEVVNPFVSLKNILGDAEFSHITLAELVTAIEVHGICAYDAFERLLNYTVDGEQGQEVMKLLREFKFHDPNYNEDHSIQEYDPPPLDDIINENFGKYPSEPQTYPSRYNHYGWLKSDLPATLSIAPNQRESSPTNQSEALTASQENVKDAQPVTKNESTHDAKKLGAIALMFPISLDEAENIKKWRRFAQDAMRNGLNSYRTAASKGRAQSMFDPAGVGEWLVNNAKMNQASVNKCLRKHLPTRSLDLAYLYEN